jgi:LmbE family N-acetylglucosaminyl deacetylase
MKFSHPEADVFLPTGIAHAATALGQTTHLCVAAHQDDIEIMAYAGIAACYARSDRWFSGVVLTNGAGSPRAGGYAAFSDEQMRAVRREEQRKAAYLGDYAVQIQLAHPSSSVKDPRHQGIQQDLRAIFEQASRVETLYLHQPADKHDTHIAVLSHCLSALRSMPLERQPKQVVGCEVWRDLDWLCDDDKHLLDSSERPNLAAALVGVFDSQITGGKRYDLASVGRRVAHATYHTSHATDRYQAITWAMDLTPLLRDPSLSIVDFTLQHIARFQQDVQERLLRFHP